jgi:HlyD family secretion protein
MTKLLPAALEFQSEAHQIDRLRPPPMLRGTFYALIVTIATAIAWASYAKVDRIVVAPGKLITTAATIVVQPLEISQIRSLEVKVGDTVRKGQALATLDPTYSAADVSQLRDRVTSLAAEVERLESEIGGLAYSPAATDRETSLQSMIWRRAMEEYEAKLDSFDQDIRHVAAQITTRDTDRSALALQLEVARDLEGMREKLYAEKYDSKVNYLSAKSQRMEIERNMQLAVNERLEFEQQLKGIQAEKAAYVADFRQKAGEELLQARRDLDYAQKELNKAERRNAITVLAAPADAIVLEVAERSIGSVVKEAEPLYTLVPLDSPLEADVMVDGRDVGMVSAGETVRLKLEAWPFQKYGTLSGRVRTVSDDSFMPDPKKGLDQRPYYKARVLMTSTKLRNVPPGFRVIPGMAVTAEIKAGQRTVLSYFLYPLLRGLDESIREP